MGVMQGSMSYQRWFVQGDATPNFVNTAEKALEARRFMPLSPSSDADEAAGFVVMESPFDDERKITRDVFSFGDLVCVTYREDRFMIPKPVLKREVHKRIEKILVDEKKTRDELSKSYLKAIEKAVAQELKHKTMPRTKLVDIVWNTSTNEARIFGRGTIVSERVASLFERTFQMRLVPATPAARAFHLDLSTRALGILERLSPGWWFPDAMPVTADTDVDGGEDTLH
jgi:DNA recombination-dependent growth factor C